nr:MAG TPA: YopX protein [Bacteriophage sp.]
MGEITWNEEEASFYFSILYENGTYEEEKLNDWANALEVIGNIYDNPELLGGE